MRTNIFDRANRLIGWTEEDGNQIRIFNRTGQFLGWYDKKTDITHNRNALFGRGNQLVRLLN